MLIFNSDYENLGSSSDPGKFMLNELHIDCAQDLMECNDDCCFKT